jgi:hypothetical protein
MPEVVPTSPAPGVPLRLPVDVLKLAQAGLLLMLNVSVSLSASLAVGVNAYAVPCITAVGGLPEIVGARFGCVTTIEKAANAVAALPSLTLIVMVANVPAALGVPVSAPLLVLNEAQEGLFAMLKVRVVPGSASLAVGVNA